MQRVVGIQYFLNECSIKYNIPEIKKIKINTTDRGIDHTQYSMAYDKNKPYLKKYCGPDWTFYHWPGSSVSSFRTTVNEIIKMADVPPTINRIAWYGNINSALPDVIESKTRPLLKQLGDRRPDIFTIVHIEPVKIEKDTYVIGKINPEYISMPELTKYTHLIDIGGNGYSGRLKYLMFTKRPILLVDRNYVEYFHDDLIPYVHYIPVKMNLSDLFQQVKWMHSNPETCKKIAMNAFEYATKHFTEDKLLDRVYEVYKNLKNQ
jgi:hypothetical protein